MPSAQNAYVAKACAAGEVVDYRTYSGLGHVPLVATDSPLIPQLISWTHDRFDGKSTRDGPPTDSLTG